MSAYFARCYFTIPIQLMLNIFFLIAYVLHYKKLKGMGGIALYAVVTLAQCVAGIYLILSPSRGRLPEAFMEIFMAVEFILFYLFLTGSIRARLFRFILKAVMILFPAAILYFQAFSPSLYRPVFRFSMTETYLIVIPCLFYYYELFMTETAVNLFNESRLWAVSGIFFFMLLSSFFTQGYGPYAALHEPSGIYAVALFGYIFLFISFIIALACQIRIQK